MGPEPAFAPYAFSAVTDARACHGKVQTVFLATLRSTVSFNPSVASTVLRDGGCADG